MSERMNGYSKLILGGLAAGLLGAEATAGFHYGWDFSDGLAGWTASGNVTEINETAVLGDTGSPHSTLYRVVDWHQSTFSIEVDVRSLLSDTVDPGTFSDAFFASVYFVDEEGSFDLDSLSYDYALPLFTIDVGQGLRPHTGTIGPSDHGEDWQHFQASLPSDYRYVIPTFELLDYNLTEGDSVVLIDNVRIIPEPRAALLFVAGTVLLRLVTRRSVVA